MENDKRLFTHEENLQKKT